MGEKRRQNRILNLDYPHFNKRKSKKPDNFRVLSVIFNN